MNVVFLSDGFAAIVPTILAGSFIFLCITVEFLQHARLVKAIFIFIALKFYENTVNKEAVLISSLCLLLSLAITYFTAVSTFFEKIVIETGAKAAATATIVLYTIVVLTLILRRTIAQLFVKKAICICFAVAVLSTLFCFVNSFLSAILVVDALNMCLYILFFVYIDSNNADSFISSIATFFWASFVATMLFFLAFMVHFSKAGTTSMASELLTAILSHGVALSTINDMLFAMFFSFFICIKLGLAPFFYWKISLLKNVYYEPACFYVIFYFSVLLTVLVKTLLLALFGFYQIAVMLYAISVFSVMSLIVFNTASATVAKFFAYSSAINGAIVLLACAAVLANS